MSRYSVTLEFIKGKPNIIADALSRNTLPAIHTNVPLQEDISIGEVLCSTTRISTTGIQQIRDETTNDNTLQKLTRTVVEGWPEVRKDCPTQLHEYWNFRDELSVENQLLFKGDRVVIPKIIQPEILRRLHEGHMGIEKMLLRARSGLTADVTNMAKNCQVCQKYAPKQSQEPIFVHEPTATRPWFKLGSDIFEAKGKYYIVVADYYSRFPYVEQLRNNNTSRSIINVFKTLFADHGFG